jgi:NAD dependent epimerase/dehydratase family enzyme
LTTAGHEVVILTRRPAAPRQVRWDGETAGPWTAEIDGSDVVVNLAGRSVNCRYTDENLRDMMDSRVFSARAVGPTTRRPARSAAAKSVPPRYRSFSVDIATAWEQEQQAAQTPHTRKVALRSAMVRSAPAPASRNSPAVPCRRADSGGHV